MDWISNISDPKRSNHKKNLVQTILKKQNSLQIVFSEFSLETYMYFCFRLVKKFKIPPRTLIQSLKCTFSFVIMRFLDKVRCMCPWIISTSHVYGRYVIFETVSHANISFCVPILFVLAFHMLLKNWFYVTNIRSKGISFSGKILLIGHH